MIHYRVECFQISFTFYNAKKTLKKQYIFPNVYDVITTSFKKFKYCVVNKKILNAENDNLLFNPFYLGIRGYWCCHFQQFLSYVVTTRLIGKEKPGELYQTNW
jgi:hypothetical protein